MLFAVCSETFYASERSHQQRDAAAMTGGEAVTGAILAEPAWKMWGLHLLSWWPVNVFYSTASLIIPAQSSALSQAGKKFRARLEDNLF